MNYTLSRLRTGLVFIIAMVLASGCYSSSDLTGDAGDTGRDAVDDTVDDIVDDRRDTPPDGPRDTQDLTFDDVPDAGDAVDDVAPDRPDAPDSDDVPVPDIIEDESEVNPCPNAPPDGPVGVPCSSEDECEPGLACWEESVDDFMGETYVSYGGGYCAAAGYGYDVCAPDNPSTCPEGSRCCIPLPALLRWHESDPSLFVAVGPQLLRANTVAVPPFHCPSAAGTFVILARPLIVEPGQMIKHARTYAFNVFRFWKLHPKHDGFTPAP